MFKRIVKLFCWVNFWLLGAVSCAYLATELSWKELTSFEYVCEELKIMYPSTTCEDLDPPIIIRSEIIDDASGRWSHWYGVYYRGEPYIFVNPDNDDEQNAITILHEMVHYVVYNNELPPMDDTCLGEEIARQISGGEWTDEDKKFYGC